jgi:hypothetical protein
VALKFDQGSGEVQGHGLVPHADFLDFLKNNPHKHTVEKEIDRIVGELKITGYSLSIAVLISVHKSCDFCCR